MLILGLNAYHADSAACLIQGGRLLALAEEERFRRTKHWAGLPLESVRYVLTEAGASLADVDRVALNRFPRAHLLRKLAYALHARPDRALVADRWRSRSRVRSTLDALETGLGARSSRCRAIYVEHHHAHLASAFLASPFEEAVVLSVDAFGDFTSAAWGVGRGTDVHIEGRIFFPHSLGVFYQAMTQYLGFPRYGDEYKAMALASYGEPRYREQLCQVIPSRGDGSFMLDLKYFRHHRSQLGYRWENCAPVVDDLFTPDLEGCLGPRYRSDDEIDDRRRDLASSVQARYGELLFCLLRALHARHRIHRLALAGGCAMNSVANGRIAQETPFELIYVQPAAGDAGGALGAALVACHDGPWRERGPAMLHASWGPAFEDREVREAIEERRSRLDRAGCAVRRMTDDAELCDEVSARLARGDVVGWFQGRMEWGPRALGNRSILADPRRDGMRDLLNSRIKRRERFRPFAPSVLAESFSEWFEGEPDWFMTRVCPVRSARRAAIPAVVHVDGTARPQAVRRESNPLFHRLITAFGDLTGVPMVLNTSFNENEPIVCRPTEALDCFLRTRMDALALGSWLVARPAPAL